MSANSTRPPYLLGLYRRYLDRQDSGGFFKRVSKRYSCGTLERLARHPNRDVRRAAVFAIGSLGDYESNHTLGRALQDDDRTVRAMADSAIRQVWTRAGNRTERAELAALVRLAAAQMHKEVLVRATVLIERAPWFAEAWQQRAVAHFALGRLIESIRDYHQVLEINPYHFIAAASMGQAYLELENRTSALECFRRALRLNPDLEGVRVQIIRLARMLEGNR